MIVEQAGCCCLFPWCVCMCMCECNLHVQYEVTYPNFSYQNLQKLSNPPPPPQKIMVFIDILLCIKWKLSSPLCIQIVLFHLSEHSVIQMPSGPNMFGYYRSIELMCSV